jgi:hypothetical protein
MDSSKKIKGMREHPEWVALQIKIAREKTCTYWDVDHFCESKLASIYGAGWRCDKHKPVGNWTVNIGRKNETDT